MMLTTSAATLTTVRVDLGVTWRDLWKSGITVMYQSVNVGLIICYHRKVCMLYLIIASQGLSINGFVYVLEHYGG